MQSSSRTSRQMLRTGAVLLELGRAAGSLSHAAQGHLGPLIYGYTAFLRPDGRVSPVLQSLLQPQQPCLLAVLVLHICCSGALCTALYLRMPNSYGACL